MKHSVLFVDDEENILNSLKRLLRKEPYRQFFCLDGKSALDVLRKEEVSVIVSDMRMPGMNGVEFLREAMKLSSDSVKIILSGYADISDILKAVNEGRIDSFFQKPWNDESLKIRLNNSCAYYEKSQREKKLQKELAEKNQQLEDVNHLLEKKVRQRTLELQESNRILKMIVEGKPLGEVVEETCRVMTKLLHLKKASLLEVKTGTWYPKENQPPESVLRRQEIGKNIISGDYLCYQLEEQKRLFGYLYLYPVRQINSNMKRVIKDFSSLMEILLLQKHDLEKSDHLVDNIDSILEELNGH